MPDELVVTLTFDASDPAHPGYVVAIGRVVDPDRTVAVEWIGAFAADDFASASGLARATGRARGLRVVDR